MRIANIEEIIQKINDWDASLKTQCKQDSIVRTIRDVLSCVIDIVEDCEIVE